MDQLNWAGVLLIGGFVLVLAASFAGPPGLYQEPDPQNRIEIVANHNTRWQASNALFALAAMRAGARGYVLKGADKREMLQSIRAVAKGQTIFGPKVAGRLAGRTANI